MPWHASSRAPEGGEDHYASQCSNFTKRVEFKLAVLTAKLTLFTTEAQRGHRFFLILSRSLELLSRSYDLVILGNEIK